MSIKRKIKFTGQAMEWFDKVNGNSYFSVVITRTRDGATINVPFQYGYGDHYRDMSLRAMASAKWLPVKYRGDKVYRDYERDNDYPITWFKAENCKKKDVIAHGQA